MLGIKPEPQRMALLDDIYDTFLHQIDLIETQKETVTDYLEIFTTMISNRLAATSNELNIVMKKMTALTIIIMIPTLIAGVYGTNFVKYFGNYFLHCCSIRSRSINWCSPLEVGKQQTSME
jgi:Mg2+ and Co2+ transporter CorA